MPEDAITNQQDSHPTDDTEHVKTWESSGVNQVTYCQANGLDYKRFVSFRSALLSRRGTTKKQKPRFIPVQAQPRQLPHWRWLQQTNSRIIYYYIYLKAV